jgi:hypothetical protein
MRKNVARASCSSGQTGKSDSASSINNTDIRRQPLPSMPGQSSLVTDDRILMFDIASPSRSGSLAGESFASVLECHAIYPSLRSDRDAALFARLDTVVAAYVISISGILDGLGYNQAAIGIYRTAALAAFRAARPGRHTNCK